jgi:hypothetical protein
LIAFTQSIAARGNETGNINVTFAVKELKKGFLMFSFFPSSSFNFNSRAYFNKQQQKKVTQRKENCKQKKSFDV